MTLRRTITADSKVIKARFNKSLMPVRAEANEFVKAGVRGFSVKKKGDKLKL